MKIKIIKPVWLFEEELVVGNIYDSEINEYGNYDVYLDGCDNPCTVYESECEVVE